jgi:23S rRNA pseudouridine1911/1915/1917 synthase
MLQPYLHLSNNRVSEQRINLEHSGSQPERIDKVLATHLPELSRSRLQSLIKAGYVSIEGRVISKPSEILSGKVQIEILVPPQTPSDLIPEYIPLEIIFENDDVIVVNKPAGMVVHPSAGHDSGTLVHAALAHAPAMEGIGGKTRPGIVHRLDKDTSGIILLAKNDLSHRWLQNQFSSRQVEKIYTALVDGSPPTPSGRVEAPIGRDPHNRKLMAVVSTQKGRNAISEYRTLENFKKHTLLEIHPITGRTHQIRLHMKFLGCPIAGDRIYGKHKATIPLSRHFLHAKRLTIKLLDEDEPRTFEAALAPELKQTITLLQSSDK